MRWPASGSWPPWAHIYGPELEAPGGRRYASGDRVVFLAPGAGRWVTSQQATVVAVGEGRLTAIGAAATV